MKIRKHMSILLTTLVVALTMGTTAFASSSTTQGPEKRYIIKFKTSSANRNNIVSRYNGNFHHDFKHFNAATAEMTTQNIAKLKQDSNVEYVEEDNVVKASAATISNWGVSDIKADASWSSGLTGKGIKIAVIDSGIASHSDLSIAGGVNVINGASNTSYTDTNGHGTHVTGIIAGKGLNGGVKGVAPDASIYAVKALDSSGAGYTSDIIAGVEWAIENKMDIISMSLGTSDSSSALKDAVDSAYNNGILIVAAAGNDGNSSGTGTNIEYPANYSSVIAVGAVDSSNKRAYFSSTGSKLEVSAPGVNIASTYLNNGYASMSGTSMATPFVAGDLALLKQKYPSYTNLQLRQLLDSNVIDLGITGKDSLYGYGLITAPSSSSTNSGTTTTPTTTNTTVTVPTPTASVASGSYKSPFWVTLSDKYSKPLKAYYTLDGSTPTTKSTLYTGYIKIASTSTLKAIAVDTYGNTSAVMTNSYTIVTPPANPVASIRSGIYRKGQTVTLSDSTPGVSIYYTTDRTIPTTKSKLYTGPITINSSTILAVIAVDSAGNSSQVMVGEYIIK